MLSPLTVKQRVLETSLTAERALLQGSSRSRRSDSKEIISSPYIFTSPKTLHDVKIGSCSVSRNVVSTVFSELKRDKSPPFKPKVRPLKCLRPLGDYNDSVATCSSYLEESDNRESHGLPIEDDVEEASESSSEDDDTIGTKEVFQLTEIPNKGLRFRDYSKIVIYRLTTSPVKFKSVHSAYDLSQKQRRRKSKKKTIHSRKSRTNDVAIDLA